jgi:hypothetical protein
MKNKLISLVILLLCSSCSLSNPPTPEMKRAVLKVADGYLRAIARNDKGAVGAMVAWQDYLENTDGEGSKEHCNALMQQLYAKFPNTMKHPLLGLELKDFDADGDEVEIKLKNSNFPSNPDISISLYWADRGWLIVGDNIFTKKGIIPSSLAD